MLYLLRHGQTGYNLENRCQGQKCDVPLNETGKLQAEEGGKAIKGKFFDTIYVSDLKRTMETFEIVAQFIDFKEFHTDKRLRERDFGELSGVSRDSKEWQDYLEAIWQNNENFDKYQEPPELFADFWKRVVGFVDSIDYKNQDVLIVGHNGPLQIIIAHLEGKNDKQYRSEINKKRRLGNCELVLV